MAKPKIAVVEDEDSLSEIYYRILRDDFNVVRAYDGQAGLELIKNESPDLAVVDVRMPRMTGLELVRRLRDENRLTMPVIILTNMIDDKVISEALDLGVKDYISKEEATSKALKDKINQALNK